MTKLFKPKLEKKSQFWLGLLVVVLSLVYIFSTLGRTTWTNWIAFLFGVFLAIFLFVEGGITNYFKSKSYRSLGFGDLVVFLTIFSGAIVLLNSILIFRSIRAVAPEWLIGFTTATGVTTGVIAGILGIVFVFTARFR